MTGPLYPLRFEPLYQYRLWGGRSLADWLKAPLPGDGPIGEAWLLSDRDDHPSRVAAGPLKGLTIAELMTQSRQQILGRLAPRFERFPLLLKFLDVREMLSVQVHPADDKTALIPLGNTGKTEAWVVLEAASESRIYAGLKPGASAADLRTLSQRTADGCLASLQPRALQVEQALQCIDFAQGAIGAVAPVVEATTPAMRERLVDCAHFRLWRIRGAAPFPVGAPDEPRILVCIDGAGNIDHDGADFPMEKGAVVLLPAAVGRCRFSPETPVTLLEAGVAVST
jgi:mannose-6-phosphate isomerase